VLEHIELETTVITDGWQGNEGSTSTGIAGNGAASAPSAWRAVTDMGCCQEYIGSPR
jgi:hypothetical protein